MQDLRILLSNLVVFQSWNTGLQSRNDGTALQILSSTPSKLTMFTDASGLYEEQCNIGLN